MLRWRNIDDDIANHHSNFVSLFEDIDSETSNTEQRNGEVHFELFVEFGRLLTVHQLVDKVARKARR